MKSNGLLLQFVKNRLAKLKHHHAQLNSFIPVIKKIIKVSHTIPVRRCDGWINYAVPSKNIHRSPLSTRDKSATDSQLIWDGMASVTIVSTRPVSLPVSLMDARLGSTIKEARYLEIGACWCVVPLPSPLRPKSQQGIGIRSFSN